MFFFLFQKAQKALLEAEAEKVPNSAESTEIDEEPVETVFIDAPPPKVNVWLKKSDNPTSSQPEQSSAQENSSQDENMEKEPTPEAPEVKTGIKTSAVTNSNAPTPGTKTTANKVELVKDFLFELGMHLVEFIIFSLYLCRCQAYQNYQQPPQRLQNSDFQWNLSDLFSLNNMY